MANTAILGGIVYTPLEAIEGGVVLFESQRIVAAGDKASTKIPAGARVVDYSDCIVVPGFVDTHTHGAAGHDFMEATPEALAAIGAFLARHGTTSYLATTITASAEDLINAASALGKIIRNSAKHEGGLVANSPPSAQPLGIYFEGPFLNVKRRGAHPAADIQKPSVDFLQRLLDAADGAARSLVIAPEMDEGLAVLQFARREGLRVGIGHSDATFDESERAIDAGATHAVHVYNAMRPFSHRDPGIIGAALTDDRLMAELICDGVHVDAAAIRLLVKAKGTGRIILVTDSLSATGMPDGPCRIGQVAVSIKNGVCRTAEGSLAGTSVTLGQVLRNFVKFAGLDFGECLPCATINPARLLGIEERKGVIIAGADADFVVLDKSLIIKQVYVRGRAVLED